MLCANRYAFLALILSFIFIYQSCQASLFCCEWCFKKKAEPTSEKTPTDLYKNLFKKPYALIEKNNASISPDAILAAAATIKNVYAKKWKKAHETNAAAASSLEMLNENKIPGDTHEPIMEKLLLSPQDTVFLHGDIHGDVLSLLSIISFLQNNKRMSADWQLKTGTKIVLLGDYTDRGLYDIEVLIVLAKLLEKNPQSLFLLRGNHETRNFGFKQKLVNHFANILANTNSAIKSAESAYAEWITTTSYLPHVLFLLLPKEHNKIQEVIACMHGAPPSYTQAMEDEFDLSQFIQHGLAVQTFLAEPTSLKKIPLDVQETFPEYKGKERTPSYLWNYVIPSSFPDETTGKMNYRPLLNKSDLQAWLACCSNQAKRIIKIIRGHQQSERELFNQTNQYGLGTQYDQLCTTLNIAPRCVLPRLKDGLWENRADTWAELIVAQKGNLVLPRYFAVKTGQPCDLSDLPAQNFDFETMQAQEKSLSIL